MKTFFRSLSLLTLGLVAALYAQGAGVTISTITCSSGTVTVNATAHGITQYQGFSITGSSVGAYNINSTASSVTANAFVFVLPSGSCSGSATGGSVLPAKQIISTGSTAQTLQGTLTINYVFWFTTATPVPCPSCVSSWASASAAENAALVAGTTVEYVGSLPNIPSATSAATIQSEIQAYYATMQIAYAAGLLSGAGYWYNGTSWVNH
jgi:hypothetical protein